MTVNIFAIVLASVDHSYTSRLKYIQDLGFLSQTHPILAVTLSATLFSMAGIPPLAGFCSKFYLFFAAMSSSLYGLAILGVLSSVVSCFYYIRLIKIMYFEAPSHVITFAPMDREKATLIGLTSMFIVFFFLCPHSIFLWTYKVAYMFLG